MNQKAALIWQQAQEQFEAATQTLAQAMDANSADWSLDTANEQHERLVSLLHTLIKTIDEHGGWPEGAVARAWQAHGLRLGHFAAAYRMNLKPGAPRHHQSSEMVNLRNKD